MEADGGSSRSHYAVPRVGCVFHGLEVAAAAEPAFCIKEGSRDLYYNIYYTCTYIYIYRYYHCYYYFAGAPTWHRHVPGLSQDAGCVQHLRIVVMLRKGSSCSILSVSSNYIDQSKKYLKSRNFRTLSFAIVEGMSKASLKRI